MSISKLILAVTFVLCWQFNAQAAGRVALVIGNSSYEHASKLPNPKNDAHDIASVLKRLGFEVTKLDDLKFSEMRRALGDFSDAAFGADMAVVFYAGHGIEVNKQNYLVPTDAKLATDRAISYEAVPLELVTEAVSGAKGLKLVMLDSCRVNPFAASMKMTNASRSIGRGLARVEPVAGTLVSFAAKEGTVAEDGRGKNSPYTKALIAHLEQPGLEIQFLFRKVRDSVMADTNQQQQPFTYGSLPGNAIYLVEPQTGNQGADASDDRLAALERELKRLRRQVQEQDALQGSKTKEKQTGVKSPAPELTADQMFSRGFKAGQRKDYAEAVKWYRKAADLGHNSATFNLAIRYYVGEGVPKDYQKALELYKKAAAQGHVKAKTSIGWIYYKGLGVKEDPVEAIKWFEEAASRDDPYALTNLGLAYRDGKGVQRDAKKAADYFNRSADLGDLRGMGFLGDAYRDGAGVKKDAKTAVKWYRTAADKNSTTAKISLANILVNGAPGVSKDYATAMQLYSEASKTGDQPVTLYNMGLMYDQGWGVAKDPVQAADLVAKSLRAGNNHAYTQMTTNSKIWSRQFRVELQRILQRQNVYTGSLDGDFGPQMRRAIKEYSGRS